MNSVLRCLLGVFVGIAWSTAWAAPPQAQDGVLVFDVGTMSVDAAEPATDDTSGEDEKKKDDDANLGERNEREITVGEKFSFRERQVQEEMSELEQRMFRLSNELKKIEPENSSRLMLGLKYARDELILHQMAEIREALSKLSLSNAVEEQKLLMAKLERLEQLLLSNDLDFEMRIERLRQIRATLRELDAVIKEESRQEQISKKAAEAEKRREKLADRKAAVEQLIEEQTAHNEANAPLAKADALSEQQRAQISELGEAQQGTQQRTQALAADLSAGTSPKNLNAAAGCMKSAVAALSKASPAEASEPMDKALEELKKERDEIAKQEAAAKKELAKERFAAMQKDQDNNRRATEDVTEMTRGLGSNGTAALAEMLRAGSAMGGASQAFGNSQAGQGNGEQGKALASLKYAKELLAEEAERLARQLRAEVKKRVTDGLTEMLKMQTDVRERTEALAPAVKKGSRQALAALTSLAKREEQIVVTAQELINVVEETEFGIALPAALAAVRDACEAVQVSLAAGDASPRVVEEEKQIEADLKAMLEIVKEMTEDNSRNPRRNQNANSPREQRKELNRIISELRMIRLLEQRVHRSTVGVDGRREDGKRLSPEMRRQIEHLEGRQADIQEATELLAIERGDEVPLPE